MLVLQVFAPRSSLDAVLSTLATSEGVDHVVRVGGTVSGDAVLVTADLAQGTVDRLLPLLLECGVPGDEISVIHRDSNRPVGTSRVGDLPTWSGGPLAWTELAMASRQYARAVPQYLIFMACAGIIAAFGIMTRNSILIVGAMAISPDLLPLCATCVGIVDRRPRLARRAFAVLVVGLAVASTSAFAATALLRLAGYGPASKSLGNGGLGVLPTVNVATVAVAAVAGVVGILAFETRSSSAVGVAISITTIPAAAFVGAAIAADELSGARGALGVLAANVLVLLLTGSLTLVVQRARRNRAG
jgi:uncharacterized hydrophobic protein (TIGR00271 family)